MTLVAVAVLLALAVKRVVSYTSLLRSFRTPGSIPKVRHLTTAPGHRVEALCSYGCTAMSRPTRIADFDSVEDFLRAGFERYAEMGIINDPERWVALVLRVDAAYLAGSQVDHRDLAEFAELQNNVLYFCRRLLIDELGRDLFLEWRAAIHRVLGLLGDGSA